MARARWTWRRGLSVAIMMGCAGLLAATAYATEVHPREQMLARGEELLARLEAGAPTRVVVYGDSLADGWGTDGTHVYARMFLDTLRYRFPDTPLVSEIVGCPGWTTADALRAFEANVTAHDPHLLVLQFGGNDRGWGGSTAGFRRDFARLLRAAYERTSGLVIACLPPFAEEIEDGPWAIAAREVAALAGIPAAGFHRAIREGPHDFRGSFPYESHPGSFTHVVMAKELLRVFNLATGAPAVLGCELTRGCNLSASPRHTVRATIVSGAEETVRWRARLRFGRQVRDLNGSIAPDETVELAEEFAVDPELPEGRAFSIPVRLCVRGGGQADFDVAWLTLAPAVSAHSSGVAAPGEAFKDWEDFSAHALTLGRHLWWGRHDLAGRFRVLLTHDSVRVEVQVMDDDLSVANLTDPSRGDSVEVYVDLRSGEGQGEPVYSEDVLALQVIPPADEGDRARWHNLHTLPADLRAMTVAAQRTREGYGAVVEVPLPAIIARRGREWGGFGLDVGINDADDGGTRKSQMMCFGTADNYLSPAYLGAVYPGRLAAQATRRSLR